MFDTFYIPTKLNKNSEKMETSEKKLEIIKDRLCYSIKNHARLHTVKQSNMVNVIIKQIEDANDINQLSAIISKFSSEAIMRMNSSLPDEIYDKCVMDSPKEAMIFTPYRLNERQIRYCAQAHPDIAITYIPDLLDDESLFDCVTKYPSLANAYASEFLSEDIKNKINS